MYLAPTINTGSQGGWDYSFPALSSVESSWDIPAGNDASITCWGSTNYVFQDPSGNRHNLALSVSANAPSPDGYDNCNTGIQGDGEFTIGGEGSILASTSIPSTNSGFMPGVSVVEADGTDYEFLSAGGALELAYSITDRNGNTATLSQSGGSFQTDQIIYVDSIGRTALSVSGTGGNPDTLTASGLTTPYQVYWSAASANFTDDALNLEPGVTAACPTAMRGSSTVVSKIVLPDGQEFTLSYDSQFGMLTKIVYPSGGYVRYVWALNSEAEAGSFPNPPGEIGPTDSYACRYGFPAISDRYVSYDGSTEVLHQNFSYSTTWPDNTSMQWTSKSTTVTTYDLIRGTNYTTVYSYSPENVSEVPNCGSCYISQQIPVESTITYNDVDGKAIETVSKAWKNVRLLQSEQTDLNGLASSLQVYCYNSWEQLVETDEFDYGNGSPTGNCAGVPAGTTSGAILRKTIENYASFATHIVNAPSNIMTYEGAGTKDAETDYIYYDANGNLISKTDRCFSPPNGQACSQGDSTTTYSYDSNGMITKMTDPRLYPTQYSYDDDYSDCGGNPPPGVAGSYITKITYPHTANGSDHINKYCYDYASGLMRSSMDENNRTSNYDYDDPLVRLTQVSYPDGGGTHYDHNDTPPAPTMTSTESIDSSPQSEVTETTMNGLGVAISTQMDDPDGVVTTSKTIDGFGMDYQLYNPFRTTTDPSYGYTMYTFDSLGRIRKVTNPDDSLRTTVYSGNCSTTSDELNRSRKTCVDALGRTTAVYEDSSGLNYETDYKYDALGDLTSVVQWGGPNGSPNARSRTFTYDSLSHLLSATNPETGKMTYTYDLNGNVQTKTDARGVTTTYSYDALNRVLSKTYSDGVTPASCYQYDSSSVTNGIGRLSNAWTLSASSGAFCPTVTPFLTKRSILAYDPMGRVLSEQQYTPFSVANGISYPMVYTYNLAGNLTSSTAGAAPPQMTLTSASAPCSITFPATFGFVNCYDATGRLQSVTSNAGTGPTTLFTAQGYAPFGGLTNATYGSSGSGTNAVTLTRSYNNRLRITSETDLGNSPSSGTNGSALVTITGVEQSR
jgi:YD repeat-containing protein